MDPFEPLERIDVRDLNGDVFPRGVLGRTTGGVIVFHRHVTTKNLLYGYCWQLETGVIEYLRQRLCQWIYYEQTDNPDRFPVWKIAPEAMKVPRFLKLLGSRPQYVVPQRCWARGPVIYKAPTPTESQKLLGVLVDAGLDTQTWQAQTIPQH